MASKEVALLTYRTLLRHARRLTREQRGFVVKLDNMGLEKGRFYVYKATDELWREGMQDLVPGILPGTEVPDGKFTGPSLADCVRENFRAKQPLPAASQAAGMALDAGITALRVLREQLRIHVCSSESEVQNGVRVESSSWYDGYDEQAGQHSFFYRLRVRNTSTSKVKLRSAVLNVLDHQSRQVGMGMTIRSLRPPMLLKGDVLEFIHLAQFPTAEGFIKGNLQMQIVRPGRSNARKEDCFAASIGPLRLGMQ